MIEMSLDYLFHPRSIAVVGVSTDLTHLSIGRNYIRALIEFGFRGKLYPVNPTGGEVQGLKVYKSILEVPDNIDYVIVAIPAHHTPQLISDSASKGVKVIQFFTAGFSEVEDCQGKELEKEILALARRLDIRIIGPNCMGIYCPQSGLTFSAYFPGQNSFPRQNGPLALISQSGGNSMYCVNDAVTRGVYFSKVVSYGNGVDINETDLFEYLVQDPETKIISAYIEGVRDGVRFARTLKEVTRLKPVIICKAGSTESGTRVAASHTGSIAGSLQIWQSLLKQANAVKVDCIEEITDAAMLFLHSSIPSGNRIAIVGAGGGPSVLAADDFSNARLSVPFLPDRVRCKLMEIFGSEAGSIFRNPVDIMMRDVKAASSIINVIADCSAIDALVLHVALDNWMLMDKRDIIEPTVESFIKAKPTLAKPAVVVLHSQCTDQSRLLASEAQRKLIDAGFPVYPSMKRAAIALKKYIRWGRGADID